MSSSDMRTLNASAAFVNRFSQLYIVPSRSVFPGHSSRTCDVPRPKKTVPSKVTYSRPREEPSLSKLAHLATRADFEIYSELRLPASSFGPRRSTEFFVRRNVHTPASSHSIDADCLTELNRLARLVEMTSKSCRNVPIYGEAPTLSSTLAWSHASQQCVAGILGFTTRSNPAIRSEFDATFPKTDRPNITFVSGQPRITKEKFLELFKSKMSELRSRLGTNTSPKGSSSLISSWINCSLSTLRRTKKPTSAQKGKKTTPPSKQNGKKTTVNFVSAATSEPSPQDTVPTTTVTSEPPHPVLPVIPSFDFTASRFEILLPDTHSYQDTSFSDRLAHAQLLLTDHAHTIRSAVALSQFNIVHPSAHSLVSLHYELLLLLGQPTLRTGLFNIKPHKHELEWSAPTGSTLDVPAHFVFMSALLEELSLSQACFSRF
jgi:hypothetical protein